MGQPFPQGHFDLVTFVFYNLDSLKKALGKPRQSQTPACWEFTPMPRHCCFQFFLILPKNELHSQFTLSWFWPKYRDLGKNFFYRSSSLANRDWDGFATLYRVQQKNPPGSHMETGQKLLHLYGISTREVAARMENPSKFRWKWKMELLHSQTCTAKWGAWRETSSTNKCISSSVTESQHWRWSHGVLHFFPILLKLWPDLSGLQKMKGP